MKQKPLKELKEKITCPVLDVAQRALLDAICKEIREDDAVIIKKVVEIPTMGFELGGLREKR
jgi:hypothetical protein